MTTLPAHHQRDAILAHHPDGELVAKTCALSPFVLRTLGADANQLPILLEGLRHPYTESAMHAYFATQDVTDEATLKRSLRLLRRQVILRLIARDLNGLADLSEVMATCTALAEFSVGRVLWLLDQWQHALYGQPVGEGGTVQQMIVVGMGKLGGRELNVSSDIDLIFAYPEDGASNGPRQIGNHDYFTRLGKKLISAISEMTEDGFVFRVDMRLRPYGESGPLVGSFAMLEEYYQNQGREWERYAWIKGRVLESENHSAQELQALLRPFVFRKYLDFGAFGSMRELKIQIQREVARRDMQENIKLGPGGIREIEFIAQVFQLIRGGQDTSLQIRPTQQVLALLQQKGILPAEAVSRLQGAYVFLRNLEHRLQYLQDAQTQTLPINDEDRARIAAGMNFTDWEAFFLALTDYRAHVARLFEEVFSTQVPGNADEHALAPLWQAALKSDAPQENPLEENASVKHLQQLGYQDSLATWQRLQSLHASGKYKQLPQVSQHRFDALVPVLLENAAAFPHPDKTLFRVFDLLESICRRASYLALLTEYPQALALVTRLASASPWLVNYLAQHPMLLDELLDTNSLYAPPDFANLSVELESHLQEAGDDVERKMDLLRHFKHAQVFRFAAQDIAGALPLEMLSDALSALADVVLDAVLRHAWRGLRGHHREQPRFAIIGYGKLGGRELGYASDLDLVFLYDDDAPEAGEVYARFGQRISAWLNSLTPAGQLYETDLRLRPDGASGLLVSSIVAFQDYQQHKAWTWEHQAITRARFCAGDTAIGAVFEQCRQSVIRQPRDIEKLRSEIIAMRQKMHDGHPNACELFELKHDAGGLVDVEFSVQFLVLAHAARCPVLVENIGNIALLHQAADQGLLPVKIASAAADAYRQLRHVQHALRLQGETQLRVNATPYMASRAAVRDLWQHLFGG